MTEQAVPITQIAGLTISRLICGSNPFLGNSYRSSAQDEWQRDYFTRDRVASVLVSCLEAGITGLMAEYEHERLIPRALEEVEKHYYKRPDWIAQVTGDIDQLDKEIRSVVDDGADACFIQCGEVDRCFSYTYRGQPELDKPNTLKRLEESVNLIRSFDLPAGIGSHHWQILELLGSQKFDIQFLVSTLNYANVHCDYGRAVQQINATDLPVIAIKTLGGNAMISPRDGLTCAFTGIKPGDIVAVGMEHGKAVEENARLAKEIIGCLKR